MKNTTFTCTGNDSAETHVQIEFTSRDSKMRAVCVVENSGKKVAPPTALLIDSCSSFSCKMSAPLWNQLRLFC